MNKIKTLKRGKVFKLSMSKSILSCLVLLGAVIKPVIAQTVGEGWHMGGGELVSPRAAETYYDQQASDINARKTAEKDDGEIAQSQRQFSNFTSAINKPEIKELARGLLNDPVLIYSHVVNHIDYVPYFGYLKGPMLTLLDQSGNDFDQAALLIALLRNAGFDANFVYGTMTIPATGGANNKDLAHWFAVDAGAIEQVFSNGGIPADDYGRLSSYEVRRVWVEATIDGVIYQLDPAFKVYKRISGINMATATGFDSVSLSTAAGGTNGADFIQNMDESGLSEKIIEYTTNLVNYIKTNHANDSIGQILGEQKIVPQKIDALPSYLEFPYVADVTWSEVPEQYAHTIRIEHGGLDETLSIPQVAGKKLTMHYDSGATAARVAQAPKPEQFINLPSAEAIPVSEQGQQEYDVVEAQPENALVIPLGPEQGQVQVHEGIALARSITLSEQVLDFAPTFYGNTLTRYLTIRNDYNFRIWVEDFAISAGDGDSSADNARFQVFGNNVYLDPNQTHQISVNYLADQIGVHDRAIVQFEVRNSTGSLRFNHGAVLTAETRSLPNLSNSSGWNFGVQVLNDSEVASVRLVNNSGSTLGINSVALINNSGSQYSRSGSWSTSNLGNGSTRNYNVRYAASQLGSHSASLRIRYTFNGLSSEVLLDLLGKTTVDPNEIIITGVNYRTRFQTSSLEAEATIVNNSSKSITLSGLGISESNSPTQFEEVSGFGNGTVAAGSQRKIKVKYRASEVGSHSATVTGTFKLDGYNYSINLPLSGITIAYPKAVLSLDDQVLAVESFAQPDQDLSQMTLSINHPYSASSGNYADQIVQYSLKRGGRYVLLSDFGQSRTDHLIESRQRRLKELSETQSSSSTSLQTETLNVIGLSWMRQTTLSDQMLGQLANVLTYSHHRFGLMAQEEGFFIDIKAQFSGNVGRSLASHDIPLFRSSGFLSSALEHGVIEQLQDATAASTVKILQLNNQNGGKLFRATSANWNTIKSQLTGYTYVDETGATVDRRDVIQTLVNSSGATLIVPQRGDVAVQQWVGAGYISYISSGGTLSQGMSIAGDYNTSVAKLENSLTPFAPNLLALGTQHANRTHGGGYAGQPGTVAPPIVTTNIDTVQLPQANVNQYTAIDPVDIASGSYLYDLSGLSLSHPEPRGLSLRPSYSSQQKYVDRGLGFGWSHNYDISIENYTDYRQGLGATTAIAAAPSIVSSFLTLELMKGSSAPTAKSWGMAALIAKWQMDQLQDKAYSVSLNNRKLSFVKLPDDTYASPAGSTMSLTKSNGVFSLKERFDSAQLTFNTDDKLQSWKDVDGNEATFTYTDDKLSRITLPASRHMQFNYVSDKLDNVQDSEGRSISFVYNAEDELYQFNDVENKPWKFTYDSEHKIETVTNPLNIEKVSNTYDALDRVKEQSFPIQGKTAVNRIYYSGFRNTEEDDAGNQTTHFFDKYLRRIGLENALGHKSQTVFDGQHHPVKSINPRGYAFSQQYDNFQNPTIATNALNEVVINAYDSQLRLEQTKDPLNNVVDFTYDAEHHLETTTSYPKIGEAIVNEQNYYANGLLKDNIDPNLTTSTTVYDANNHVDTVKVGNHPVIDYDYDDLGRLKKLTPQVGGPTQYDYNDRGQVTKVTDPLNKETIFTYDDVGQNKTITDRNNKVTTMDYTPDGRLERTTFDSGEKIEYFYDNRGNVEKITDTQGTLGDLLYDYDDANRLVEQTDANGFVVKYDYDEAGNLKTLTYPGNKVVTYTYDALDRLDKLTTWLTDVTDYDFDKAGRLKTVTHGNGTMTSYDYDNSNRLTGISNAKASSEIINQQSFTLDDNGNRLTETRTQPQEPVEQSTAVTYQYNTEKNRLDSYTPNSSSALSVQHDFEGQQTGNYGLIYSFNERHQLTSFQTVANGAQLFEYDAAGNRVKATRNGVTKYYIYDANNNLLAEANASKVITRYYVHGAGLDQMIEGNNAYTYHFDAIGSTMAITDDSQSIVNQYAYSPYGRGLGKTEVNAQPFTYVGQYGVHTEVEDIFHMRARYYDSYTGRFISEDPIGFEGGINLYAYADANPILYNDPSGNCPWCVGFVLGFGGDALLQIGNNFLLGNMSLSESILNVNLTKAAITGAQGAVGLSALKTLGDLYKSGSSLNAAIGTSLFARTQGTVALQALKGPFSQELAPYTVQDVASPFSNTSPVAGK